MRVLGVARLGDRLGDLGQQVLACGVVGANVAQP
jgi:hypothetical protein